MNDHFRSRAWLDLSYLIGCTARIEGVCEGGDAGEPMHSNQARHGKGGAIKAHDCFIASGCRACHRELDQGRRFSRDEKMTIFELARDETLLTFAREGLLVPRSR